MKFTVTAPISLFFIQRNWHDSDTVAGGEDSKQGVSGGDDETTLMRAEAVGLHRCVSRKLVSEWKLERDRRVRLSMELQLHELNHYQLFVDGQQ